MSLQTFELTVIGEHENDNQVTADHYAIECHCERDAIRDAIRFEKDERPGDWTPICVIRGHIEVCWGKDE